MVRFVVRLAVLLLLMAGAIWGWERLKGTGFFRSGEVRTSHHVVLQEMTAMGKLELVRYRFRDIVEHEIVKPLLPNAKALVIVEGEAVGCVDLTRLRVTDLADYGQDSLIVHLPAPELCYARIDHTKSKVYNTEYAFLDEAQLIDEAYRRAETKIERTAIEAGLLDQTRINAEKILKPTLEKVAGKTVLLRYRPQGTIGVPR
jgi:hypothetical protein